MVKFDFTCIFVVSICLQDVGKVREQDAEASSIDECGYFPVAAASLFHVTASAHVKALLLSLN